MASISLNVKTLVTLCCKYDNQPLWGELIWPWLSTKTLSIISLGIQRHNCVTHPSQVMLIQLRKKKISRLPQLEEGRSFPLWVNNWDKRSSWPHHQSSVFLSHLESASRSMCMGVSREGIPSIEKPHLLKEGSDNPSNKNLRDCVTALL